MVPPEIEAVLLFVCLYLPGRLSVPPSIVKTAEEPLISSLFKMPVPVVIAPSVMVSAPFTVRLPPVQSCCERAKVAAG